MLTHPFERWPRTGRRRALLLVIAVAIAMQIVLALLDGPLRESGDGTVDFEVAGSAERAGQIVDNWRAQDLLANAAFIDGLDFLFAATVLVGLYAVHRILAVVEREPTDRRVVVAALAEEVWERMSQPLRAITTVPGVRDVVYFPLSLVGRLLPERRRQGRRGGPG